MNEDVVKQAITELNASVVALTTKKDNTLIKTVITTLIAAAIIGGFVSWETSKATTYTIKKDIRDIKLYDNHNNTIIEKTLKLPLIYHDDIDNN